MDWHFWDAIVGGGGFPMHSHCERVGCKILVRGALQPRILEVIYGLHAFLGK